LTGPRVKSILVKIRNTGSPAFRAESREIALDPHYLIRIMPAEGFANDHTALPGGGQFYV